MKKKILIALGERIKLAGNDDILTAYRDMLTLVENVFSEADWENWEEYIRNLPLQTLTDELKDDIIDSVNNRL